MTPWEYRFRFERIVDENRPDYFALKPVSYSTGQEGVIGVISYRRILRLKRWCREQFGHELTRIETSKIIFHTDTEMVLFVALWSGIEIEPVTHEELEDEDKREGQAAARLGLEY